MRYLIIAMALLLGGCSDYRCIGGKVYNHLDGDVWALSGIYANTPCEIIKEKS